MTMSGGTTFSIGQLLDAADREAREQKAQGQTKIAQAASPAETIDLLSTPAVLAMAQAGRKLASRMKLAEDDMEGPSGVNTGSTPQGMKDSLTPSAETPRQFYVTPTGKTDVSPSDNKYSIPTQTEQKAPEPSMNPGASTPGQFMSPKIGQAADLTVPMTIQGKVPTPAMVFEGGGPVAGGPVDLPPRALLSPDLRTAVPAGTEAVERGVAKKEGASQKKAQSQESGAMDFTGGGSVGGGPVALAPRAPLAPPLRTAVPAGAAAVERGTEQVKTQALDPVRAVHERYSRAAAALAKQAQPGGEAQPSTETGPMVGPGKPEASKPSGDTTGGDKPPTSEEGVRDLTRQDADAKALADAASKTDLPVAAAKETTEGVLDEVLKAAAATDQVKAAAFQQWFKTLPPESKLAGLIRNRMTAAGR
jgi:hypothetical protein